MKSMKLTQYSVVSTCDSIYGSFSKFQSHFYEIS